jgi:hypothetical protein
MLFNLHITCAPDYRRVKLSRSGIGRVIQTMRRHNHYQLIGSFSGSFYPREDSWSQGRVVGRSGSISEDSETGGISSCGMRSDR